MEIQEETLAVGDFDADVFSLDVNTLLAPLHSLPKKPPKFNLKQMILSLRHMLVVWRDPWKDEAVTKDFLRGYVIDIIKPAFKKVKDEILIETLYRHANNGCLTRELWEYLSIRLAGNIQHLRNEVLTPTLNLTYPQWAMIETIEAERFLTKNDKQGGMLEFCIRTGQMAGVTFKKFIPSGFMPSYGDILGLGKFRWDRTPRMYVGTGLLAFLSPTAKPSSIDFTRVHAPDGLKKLNHKQVAARGEPCAFDKNYLGTCAMCHRGFMESGGNFCVLATHRYSWEKRTCVRCGKDKWFYRHWSKSHVCVSCSEFAARGG